MAELEKLYCTDSKVESLKKINAIIENGGSGGLEIGDIGIAPLGIDETKGKRRYLNGQILIQDQYKVFTDKLKSAVELYPSLACSESEWQTTSTMTVGGQVGKFVIDDEAGTIRLPKIIMPIQGLTDLSKLAEIVEAGLPDHNHTLSLYDNTDSGKTAYLFYENGNKLRTFNTSNASNSNSTYGNSDTVQQEQIQYPYFIQVATGAETVDNIVNEIELNNPFSLLDYKYSEYELNNLSWLRSNGQWNSKAVHTPVYELLLKIYNGTETKAGVSVKLSSETYTDYDFVLNTADETFMLPIKVKLASGKAVVGNEYGLGFDSGQGAAGRLYGYLYDDAAETGNYVQGFASDTPRLKSDTSFTYNEGFLDEHVVGILTADQLGDNLQYSGIETSDKGLYLYFYVGETVQNANLINAGRIQEQMLTRGNKEEIVSWGMPDYTKGIGITFTSTGFTYTAPANGFVSVQILISQSAVGELKINDVVVLRGCSGTKETFGDITGQVVVRKGDVITTVSAYAGTTETANWATFYPMKGAN